MNSILLWAQFIHFDILWKLFLRLLFQFLSDKDTEGGNGELLYMYLL